MVRTGKLIPKEIILPTIAMLGDRATWTNIYNESIGENGKRYASNDVGFTLDNLLEKKIITEKMQNKQTRVFSLTPNANNNYDDFLKMVANIKKIKLEQLVEQLDHKQIFTKKKEFVQKNHEDFTKFMIALEDSAHFYTNLLHTRENSEDDDIFTAKITYVIKLTNESIQKCCRKLKYGKEQDERILINGQIENVVNFLNL
jgi:6-pyruvoyl-tetrahydropterin synthase